MHCTAASKGSSTFLKAFDELSFSNSYHGGKSPYKLKQANYCALVKYMFQKQRKYLNDNFHIIAEHIIFSMANRQLGFIFLANEGHIIVSAEMILFPGENFILLF